MSDDDPDATAIDRDILHGDAPPGAWTRGSVSGSWLTFRLPLGVEVADFAPSSEECVELVMDIHGEHGDDAERRPVELWAVAYHPDRIVMNYRDTATVIDAVVGLSDAATTAAEWMAEYPGET